MAYEQLYAMFFTVRFIVYNFCLYLYVNFCIQENFMKIAKKSQKKEIVFSTLWKKYNF